ncbi:hypothetical protein HID58_042874 [Brassica napus]|uniref:Plant disease resistance WDH domain-containing protein n=1 Tax=Brassica napus TaxID=3708 RepID=A0ABQ8BEY8_BRANA|nr:hypothetical protein HID58_042874 [Brassica napus]
MDTINKMPLREMSWPVLASLLALAAYKLPEKRRARLCSCAIACGFAFSKSKRSGAKAASMLLRFNISRTSSVKLGYTSLGNRRTDMGGFLLAVRFRQDHSAEDNGAVVSYEAKSAQTHSKLVTPVGEVARQVSLLETGSDKRIAKPCFLGRTCSDSSHRVRDKI